MKIQFKKEILVLTTVHAVNAVADIEDSIAERLIKEGFAVKYVEPVKPIPDPVKPVEEKPNVDKK